MRRIGSLVVVALLLAMTPIGSAQSQAIQETSTTVHADGATEVAEGELAVVPLDVRYTYPTLAVATDPTEAELEIIDPPSGLEVSLGTSQLLFDLQREPHRTHATSVADTQLSILALEDGEATSGVVRIAATSQENGALQGSAGEAQVLVHVVDAEPLEESASDSTSTQEASVAPAPGPSSSAAVVAGGVAAVLAGSALALVRRVRG